MPKVNHPITKEQAQRRIRYLLRLSNNTSATFGLTEFLKGKQTAYDECLEIIKNIQ